MKITNLKEKVFNLILIALIVTAFYAIFKIPCLFKALFDITCPGCGMTRAYLSLLRLDFRAAFSYHPMFWSVPILVALYLFDGRLFRQKRLNHALIILLSLGFLFNWLLKLL